MNLIIDQGNTLFKTALFNDNELVNRSKFKYTDINKFNDWLSKNNSSSLKVITSSVTNDIINLNNFDIINHIHLSSDTKLPIKNNYKTPKTLGNDRIANATAAWHLNPNKNSLVIDMGTCIKYDLINSDGEYLGGNISPGLEMRYKAINSFTDQLPLLSANQINQEFGTDTKSSIECGVELGMQYEIEGFIKQYKALFSHLTIFMTGGDAKHFDKSFKSAIFANSNLTLIGLNEILRYNG
jgi:type III pantothenate kinase